MRMEHDCRGTLANTTPPPQPQQTTLLLVLTKTQGETQGETSSKCHDEHLNQTHSYLESSLEVCAKVGGTVDQRRLQLHRRQPIDRGRFRNVPRGNLQSRL